MSETPLPPPDFEIASAYPVVGRLRQAAAAHDWAAIRAFYAELPPGQDRTFVLSALDSVPGIEVPLGRLVSADPDDLLAATLLAAREVTLGWEARTGASAKQVSAEQFAALFGHLRRAERLLIRVTALDPSFDPAWATRLNTALGLQLGQNEARRRYDRLARHQPSHFTGQARLLQQLCPKWGGTWEAAHGFARECMLGAPGGALNGGLVAEAHMEHWMALGGADKRSEYLRQSHVHRELAEAAEYSVLHPEFRRPFGWVVVEGTFAALFSLIGDRERAAAHFRALGDLASTYPWSYLGTPADAYTKYRADALARG